MTAPRWTECRDEAGQTVFVRPPYRIQHLPDGRWALRGQFAGETRHYGTFRELRRALDWLECSRPGCEALITLQAGGQVAHWTGDEDRAYCSETCQDLDWKRARAEVGI
jgi:hypothetical protein